MSLRRQIACCLGFLSAGFLLLGCGSGDQTSAEIDPVIASELSVQLDRIEAFFDVGNCDRATGAVDTLEAAIEARSGQTGEEFTASAQELAANLGEKVAEECVAPEDETSTSTSTTTDVETTPTTTDVETTPTTTTDDETTTTEDDDETTTTPDPPTTPAPPTNPGNGNGPPDNPGGGITPGKQGAGR